VADGQSSRIEVSRGRILGCSSSGATASSVPLRVSRFITKGSRPCFTIRIRTTYRYYVWTFNPPKMSTTNSQNREISTNGSSYFCIEGVRNRKVVRSRSHANALCKLPKGYTWQDLKDLVRKEAAHSVWTEMALFSTGRSGETGWARVQRREEATRLYGESGGGGGTLWHAYRDTKTTSRIPKGRYGVRPEAACPPVRYQPVTTDALSTHLR
jgi:hypothetical protein